MDTTCIKLYLKKLRLKFRISVCSKYILVNNIFFNFSFVVYKYTEKYYLTKNEVINILASADILKNWGKICYLIFQARIIQSLGSEI